MGEKQRPHSDRQNQGLVDSIARDLIRQEKVVLKQDKDSYLKLLTRNYAPQPGPDTAANVYSLRELIHAHVINKILDLSAETLGRIVSAGHRYHVGGGPTSLYQIHNCRPWLDPKESGHILLITIAATTIIARMWDILHEEFRTRPDKTAIPAS